MFLPGGVKRLKLGLRESCGTPTHLRRDETTPKVGHPEDFGWVPGRVCWGVGLALAVFLGSWMMLDGGRRPVEAAVSKERLEAGAKLFHERGCVFCHGEDLNGTEKAPYLNSIGRQWSRAQIEKQILGGGGGMPAFGEILPGDEVATLVDFLSSRKKPVPKGWKPWGGVGEKAKD